jgi:hypothetical protein
MLRLSRCLVVATAFVAIANSGCDSSPPPAPPVARAETTVTPAKSESVKKNWKQMQPRGFMKTG